MGTMFCWKKDKTQADRKVSQNSMKLKKQHLSKFRVFFFRVKYNAVSESSKPYSNPTTGNTFTYCSRTINLQKNVFTITFQKYITSILRTPFICVFPSRVFATGSYKNETINCAVSVPRQPVRVYDS